jgi:hypothetical protein
VFIISRVEHDDALDHTAADADADDRRAVSLPATL